MNNDTKTSKSYTEADYNFAIEVAATTHDPAWWDFATEIEEAVYPENFAPHPDADPYDADGNPIVADPVCTNDACQLWVHHEGECDEREWEEDPVCECEIDWKCYLCKELGRYHSVLDR